MLTPGACPMTTSGGLLYYVAQSFLLAGSIFGLDQYLRIIKKHYHEKPNE